MCTMCETTNQRKLLCGGSFFGKAKLTTRTGNEDDGPFAFFVNCMESSLPTTVAQKTNPSDNVAGASTSTTTADGAWVLSFKADGDSDDAVATRGRRHGERLPTPDDRTEALLGLPSTTLVLLLPHVEGGELCRRWCIIVSL